MAVKLRKPIEVPVPNGDAFPEVSPIPLKPLLVSGLVISKTALIDALQVYASVIDLEVVEDGQRFILTLAAPPSSLSDPSA